MTLSELIARAADGEALWVPELRNIFSGIQDAVPVILRLHCLDGHYEDRPLSLPHWACEPEKCFVEEFLWAEVYNLLSVYSGRDLRIYFPAGDNQLEFLVDALPEVFQLHASDRHGYGKVINIADRLCRAQGLPPFSFFCSPIEQYDPLPDTSSDGLQCSLSEQLCARIPRAEQLILCGIDIGGTDIKLALSVNGRLVCTGEYDWNPALSTTAEGILTPILQQLESIRLQAASILGLKTPPLLDGIGISFPDIVIGDRILGGETPKTAGLRANRNTDYETEFAKLSGLKELLLSQCSSQAVIRIINDGNMAAFTAAMEIAAGSTGPAASLSGGLLAHTLGTDLGTGWLLPDGSVPQIPLELYDLIIDLGNFPAAALPPQDLRSTRNENSALPGARRYLGQAAAFRLARELAPNLLDSFTQQDSDLLLIRTKPEDLRKPCLEHLMRQADNNPDAQEVFRRIGLHLGVISREAQFLMHPQSDRRYIYGRFVKSAVCFSLMQEGCAACTPELQLVAADDSLANTPLMRQLAARQDVTVAQFGQAVGALYYAIPT